MADELTIKDLVQTPPTDLLAWSVMHLISRYAGPKMLERFGIDASNHDNTIKVELRINGIEVSPKEVFAELDRQHTEMVKRHAMELIQEKCRESDAVVQLMNELRSLTERKAAEALGVDWKDRW